MRLGRPTFALLGFAVIGLTALLCWWTNQQGAQAQSPFGNHDHWAIEFVPRKAESVSLVINGKVWNPHKTDVGPTWDRRDGRVIWKLPSEFARHDRLHIVAVAHPWNDVGEIIISHGGHDRRRLTFSRAEETEIIK